MVLIDIPPEILFVILQHLEASDILNVRQTCRTLRQATYDRAIWMALLQEQITYLPFSPKLQRTYLQDRHLNSYSTSTVEAFVVKAQKTSEAWSNQLGTGSGINRKLYKIKREEFGSKLLGLEMVLDRWILAFYFEGVVRVYDATEVTNTSQNGRLPPLRASLVNGDPYMSYAVSLAPSRKKLFLALGRPKPPHIIEIFEVDLDVLTHAELSISAFNLIQTMFLPSYGNIKALNSTERSIVLSLPTGAEIIPWGTDYADAEARMTITVQNEDLDSLVDGIVAVTFIGRYLLISRMHTLSVHDYKGSNKLPFPDLKHKFSLTFRQVSFSDYSVTHNAVSEMEIYEMSIFAYDVIQGLFHYTIKLSIPPSPSGIPPSLDVHLTGVYPLAVGIVQPPALSASSHSNLGPSGSSSHEITTSNSEYGSRGFLSAHCVGPQAKRAIWVERKRSSTSRKVYVWSCEKPWEEPVYVSGRLDGSGRNLVEGERSSTVEMKKRVVYSLVSYDLRDDINYCAFGEVDGTIVLGHRSGDISVLKL